ncbi:MAG: DUF488 domain-containing protein [Nitrospirae bacterium]|nr:DUF488 domain-containing protein [Nitrospirota bacterium]
MIHTLYTIGHSTHSLQEFIQLLKLNNISAVGDVRSTPYSRINPQFNRETIKAELERNQIAYVFLGNELGARSDNPSCYVNGKVQYKSLEKQPLFLEGLDRIRFGLQKYRIALMCAEKDPLTCHRTILICRSLRKENIEIKHIWSDGTIENHQDSEKRLLKNLNLATPELFATMEDLINKAYDLQSEKIAYTTDSNKTVNQPITYTEKV